MKTINRAELRSLLDISDKTVSNLLQQGMPVVERGSRGRSAQFDPIAVRVWYDQRQADKGQGEDYQTSRARREAALASIAEIELAELNESVVRVEDVAKSVEAEYTRIRSKLLAIPTKASGLILGLSNQSEITSILDDQIREVLQELSAQDGN